MSTWRLQRGIACHLEEQWLDLQQQQQQEQESNALRIRTVGQLAQEAVTAKVNLDIETLSIFHAAHALIGPKLVWQ